MTYQIIRDAQGNIVYSGPNDGTVNPFLADGQVLTVEDKLPAAYLTKLKAEAEAEAAVKASAHTKLAALGLTADEIAAL